MPVCLFILLTLAMNHIVAATQAGELKLTVLFDNKPVSTAVVITEARHRNHVILQTEHVHGDSYRHMQPTPFSVELPAGDYDLYVHANVSPLKIYLRTRAIPIIIAAGKTLQKRITIPAGHLHIGAQIEGRDIAGMSVDIAASAAYKDRLPGFENYTHTARVKTPVDIAVPPGQYSFTVRNPQSRQSKKASVRVRPGESVKRLLSFKPLRAGYLKVNVLMDGKPLPQADRSRYVSLTITDDKSGKTVNPLPKMAAESGIKLPAGDYTVTLHERALNGHDRVFKLHIDDKKTVSREISIQQPGQLSVSAMWTGQPVDISHFGDCLHYYNPFNSDHLGTLMGGHTVSRGKCTSSRIDELLLRLSDAGGRVIDTTMTNFSLLPGTYTLTVWPKARPELRKTLHDVKISSGASLEKQLEFRWQQ